jgi:hypothetical protein
MPKGIPSARTETALLIAQERGLNEASRATGISVSTLERVISERGLSEPLNPEVLPVPFTGSTVVELDPNEVIDGLPERGTRAYIDQHTIARRAAGQAAYVAARRGELRVKMVDTAHTLIDKLNGAETGNDAKSWAIAVGIVFDKVRLDSGQVTDLRGVAIIRGDLDEEQRKEYGNVTDLSKPVGVLDVASTEISEESLDAEAADE